MCFNDSEVQLIQEALYVTCHFYDFFKFGVDDRSKRMRDIYRRISDFYSYSDDDLPF